MENKSYGSLAEQRLHSTIPWLAKIKKTTKTKKTWDNWNSKSSKERKQKRNVGVREDRISDDSGSNNASDSKTQSAYRVLWYEETGLPLLPSDLEGTITSAWFKQDWLRIQMMSITQSWIQTDYDKNIFKLHDFSPLRNGKTQYWNRLKAIRTISLNEPVRINQRSDTWKRTMQSNTISTDSKSIRKTTGCTKALAVRCTLI